MHGLHVGVSQENKSFFLAKLTMIIQEKDNIAWMRYKYESGQPTRWEQTYTQSTPV